MNHQAQFGWALKLVRRAMGMSQADLSHRSSRTHISSLERGLKSPTLGIVERIAYMLHIHPATLLIMLYIGPCETDHIIYLLNRIETEIRAIARTPVYQKARRKNRKLGQTDRLLNALI